MNSYRAEIGDMVQVSWASGLTLKGTVKSMPQDVGDSWVVVCDDGTIYHIQQYETIMVLGRIFKD